MTKPALIALAVVAVLCLALGALIHRAAFPCPVIDVTATEDSIRARLPVYDSLAVADRARTRILDSIKALPTIPQREVEALRFVRSIDLDRQLDSVLTEPY